MPFHKTPPLIFEIKKIPDPAKSHFTNFVNFCYLKSFIFVIKNINLDN